MALFDLLDNTTNIKLVGDKVKKTKIKSALI